MESNSFYLDNMKDKEIINNVAKELIKENIMIKIPVKISLKKMKVLVAFLVLIIVVIGGFLIYTFVIAPSISGYVVDKQNEGVQFALVSVFQAAGNCQQVPLTFNNQTINLVAVECLQQAPVQVPSGQR